MNSVDYPVMKEAGAQYWWYKAKRDVLASFVAKESRRKGSKLDILEVGCGMGTNLDAFLPYGNVSGADSDAKLVGHYRKLGKFNFKVAPVEKMPYASGSFDVVVASEVLEHVADHQTAVREISRVLRKGGCAIITVPAHPSLFGPSDRIAHHQRRYTKRLLKELLEREYAIEYVGYWNAMMFAPTFFLKLAKRFASKGESLDHGPIDEKLNAVLYKVMGPETSAIEKGIELPFGITLVCLARKKER